MFDSDGIELLPGESFDSETDTEAVDDDELAYRLTWDAFWDEKT